ncbi:MAG: HAD family hydrolase [Acidimicrobiales bacterium]
MSSPAKPTSERSVDLGGYDAWLFDMDGVLTKTAAVHAAAWKQAFDEFLKRDAASSGASFVPFDLDADYEKYVDGEPREDGVRNFLASRGITLPEGSDDDSPDTRSVRGLGNRKNDLVLEVMKKDGVGVFEGVQDLVQLLRHRGVKVAVISASENTTTALKAAGILELFDAVVDGHVVKDRHLRGKPAPDSFLEGARVLGVAPARAVVLEDALAGVAAGRAGNFALVIGVDHHDTGDAHDYADQLRAHGANVVVTNLAHLVDASPPTR